MENRATSNDLRLLIRESVKDGNTHLVADIKQYIKKVLKEKGMEYSNGQISGAFTNMCKSGELRNPERGYYTKGPKFDKRAAYYDRHIMTDTFSQDTDEKQKDLFEISEDKRGGIYQEVLKLHSDSTEFQEIYQSILDDLQSTVEKIETKQNEIKVGQASEEDLKFILELKGLEKDVKDFVFKYKTR